MQSNDQIKSSDKHSSHESQDRKRPRPSLFPLRNSVKRKSSVSENHNIFDPHYYSTAQTSASNNVNESDRIDYKDNKSDSSFQYRTPSVQSDYESPKTPRSIPKEFIFDTPFVPFVHQSLTKSVWQSEEVIPEERDDIERKQSQTQNVKFMQIAEQDENEKQEIVGEENTENQAYQSFQYQENKSMKMDKKFNRGQQDPNLIMKQQMNSQLTQWSNSKEFQSCNPVSLTICTNEKLDEQMNVLSNQKIILKNENTEQRISHQNQQDKKIQMHSDIQHQVFVSRAPIYYEQEQQTIQRKMGLSQSNHFQVPTDRYVRKLGFSYLDSISIRSKVETSQKGQQTFPRALNKNEGSNILIVDKEKKEQECQIDSAKLQICNAFCNQTPSVGRKNYGIQISYHEKLKLVSKKYEQQIGFFRQYKEKDQQTQVQTKQSEQQTEQAQKKLSIQQQVNFSISHNYGQHADQKVTRLQNYIRDLYQSKQSQLRNAKNKRLIDRQINTDNIPENLVLNSAKKMHSSAIKSIRNFGCQYDTKDTGLRPSLKRVSIADTKVIYEIDQSISTESCQQMSQKNEKRKSKRSTNKTQVKLQQAKQDSEQQEQPAQASQQVKKSKRKTSKTPRKKKSKK